MLFCIPDAATEMFLTVSVERNNAKYKPVSNEIYGTRKRQRAEYRKEVRTLLSNKTQRWWMSLTLSGYLG